MSNSEDLLLTRRNGRVDARIAVLAGDNGVIDRGSHVVLEDLDDATRAEYVLVASPESDPEHGRLSDESPVGRAISGHRQGDVVDAHAPHRVRHLRIAEVDAGGADATSPDQRFPRCGASVRATTMAERWDTDRK